MIRFIANSIFNKYQASFCKTGEVNTNQTVAIFLQNDGLDDPENIVRHMHILLSDGTLERER